MNKQARNTAMGCTSFVIIVAVITLIANWEWYFGDAQERLAAEQICVHIQVVNQLQCEELYVFGFYLPQLDVCQKQIGSPKLEDTDKWLQCLQSQGVDLVVEFSQ